VHFYRGSHSQAACIPLRPSARLTRRDPEAIRRLKESVEQDIHIGGAELAAQAFRAGLIDECHLFIKPIIVGGGKRALPDRVRLELELLEERRFASGMVHLHYRAKA
jgi:dihydrofolate reductase